MDPQNIDEFLAVLQAMLRLGRSKREEITRELRDHLLERWTELQEQGVSADRAMAESLREFGDAAVLASSFVGIMRQRRRRMIMRGTIGTAFFMLIGIIVGTAYWPENRFGGPAKATAQEEKQAAKSDAGSVVGQVVAPTDEKAKPASFDARTAKTRKILATKEATLQFEEKPLGEVLDTINKSYGIQIILDVQNTSEARTPVTLETPVSKKVKDISLGYALELLLRDFELTYMIREGLITITTPDVAYTQENLVIEVYNVSDLIVGDGLHDIKKTISNGGTKMMLENAVAPTTGSEQSKNQNAGGVKKAYGGPVLGGGPMLGESVQPYQDMKYSVMDQLINVIENNVAPKTWTENGGEGTIEQYGNLLIISHTAEVHQKVENLLEKIRAAKK